MQPDNVARVVQHDGIPTIIDTVGKHPADAELVAECIAAIDIISRTSKGVLFESGWYVCFSTRAHAALNPRYCGDANARIFRGA